MSVTHEVHTPPSSVLLTTILPLLLPPPLRPRPRVSFRFRLLVYLPSRLPTSRPFFPVSLLVSFADDVYDDVFPRTRSNGTLYDPTKK